MRIRRSDTEDATTTEELLATALTHDLSEWLRQYLGESDPVGPDTRASIFHVLMERMREGVVI
jgi:hypothetical protein